MQVLFVHQNFPGQYLHLARALLDRGDRVHAIGGPTARPLPGVALHRYDPRPAGGIPDCHPWVADLQTKSLRAEAVGTLLQKLLEGGLQPDVVVGHPGWGELLAVKDLLPSVPVLHQVEFVYQLSGGDTDFDPEFAQVDWVSQTRLRLRRAPQLLALHDLDWGVAPTPWQASTVPAEYRQRLSVIHEGIDTTAIAPRDGSFIALEKAGQRFKPGDPLVTFVARSLEPYRGFHVFLRALPRLLALRPDAHVIVVGDEGVSYGPPPAGGGSWKQRLLQELQGQLDLSRLHFVGRVPHPVLHDLFRVSACHVYLTYPFVLSWSLLEAMSCGATVVASATPPVQDVIQSGINGLLVDFFDSHALADTVAAVLADPPAHRHLGIAARRSVVDRFDLHSICLPQLLQLVDRLAGG
ncbi:MAG: glycosyltransferase [Cyanobacteriota bacterium]|nr:glycosyltransferase [Cyanobacteriota bacterium]